MRGGGNISWSCFRFPMRKQFLPFNKKELWREAWETGISRQSSCPLVSGHNSWSRGHEFESLAGQKLGAVTESGRSLGFRSSTLVTPSWYVLPDLEHCLSSCIKITAWHVIGRFTCPMSQQMTLLYSRPMIVQYQKGVLEGAVVCRERPAETQTICTG